MKYGSRRTGVASIVGTVVFMVVFMLALGALSYVSGLQAQASGTEVQAQRVASLRAGESLSYSGGQSSLAAVDGGESSVSINHVILRFPNGTVYAIPAAAVVPTGGELQVQTLVPSTLCAPGTATCASKYQSIVSGAAPGSSVGLVTSLGNVFWYSGSSGGAKWAQADFLASGTWTVPSGVSAAFVVCIGGGGGGGGSGGATDTGGADGGGGGGGGGVGSLEQEFVDLGGATSVPVTVGPGGSGGPAGSEYTNGGPGGDGASSSFGSFVACGGGGGGAGSLSDVNSGGTKYCYSGSTAPGGAGDGVPGGTSSTIGVLPNAVQETIYGGGGGGGGEWYIGPGAGSSSDSINSGAVFTSFPGASGSCASGGGGGSASPFAAGGTGGSGAGSCGSGQAGAAGQVGSGAGGGGGGGSYSTSTTCGVRPGGAGGAGGSGQVIVYYQG